MLPLIRRARREDIPVLRELIPLSVRALSRGYYTPRQIESALAHLIDVDTQLIDDGTYFAAEIAGCLVGAGGWSRRRALVGLAPAEGALLDPALEPASIRGFFVHPRWARRGIGRRLLQASRGAAQRAGFSRLELVATLSGEPLYAALGFAVQERLVVRMLDGVVAPAARMIQELSAR